MGMFHQPVSFEISDFLIFLLAEFYETKNIFAHEIFGRGPKTLFELSGLWADVEWGTDIHSGRHGAHPG
jgi:hypothetical protein